MFSNWFSMGGFGGSSVPQYALIMGASGGSGSPANSQILSELCYSIAPDEEVKMSSIAHSHNDSAMKSPYQILASNANERGGVHVRVIEGQHGKALKSPALPTLNWAANELTE